MSTRLRSAPTIKDVARHCGISEAAVSYAMNGKPGVNEETRERVMEAVRTLNYRPSAVARGLTKKRVHMLGVLFGQVEPARCLKDPYMSGVLAGVMAHAQREGYHISLFTECLDNPHLALEPLCDGRTDGILALAPLANSEALHHLQKVGVPVVSVSGKWCPGVALVDVDNRLAMRSATEHLLQLGHRDIALFSPHESLACAQQRREGFRDAMQAAGIPIRPELMQYCLLNSTVARQKAREVLGLAQRPTAIIAGNDSSALSVLEVARSLGIEVPERLSLVGFDDNVEASVVSPPLTSVRQPLQAIGEKAAQLLIEAIRHPQKSVPSAPVLFPAEVIVRQSSGPAPRHTNFI